jgi:hypothetical protein
LIPRQLPASPFRVVAQRIKNPHDVPVERPQGSDALDGAAVMAALSEVRPRPAPPHIMFGFGNDLGKMSDHKHFAPDSPLFQRFIDSRRGKLLQRIDDLQNKIKSPQRRSGTQEGGLGY